ncbi:uncharacterized protein LOC131943962 [Physella acuta]|uniref:uncharacterized protein LOC131943962 n=1 Tax=Physella acuta TaxID=109671 RepID=UPI0027DB375D|nr:uncharacterized protein LOC131943962 [Physella acuta]
MLLLVFVFLLTVSSTKEKTPEQVFATFDKNGDTFLSRVELKSTFAKYDTNRDRIVTKSEYVNFVTTNEPCVNGEIFFAAFDSNNDNKLTDDDYNAMFDSMNANSDTGISMNEHQQYMETIASTPGAFKQYCPVTEFHQDIVAVHQL